MATPPTALPNISSIGTPDAPVEVIYVKIIQKLENLSYKLSTMGVGAETYAGQTFDTGTNAIAHVENVTAAGTFISTGAAQINNTLGVTGTSTMAAITASGVITANGGITAGGHFTMGTWNLSGAGGNNGLGFSGATAIFSDPVNINALLTMGGNIKSGGTYYSYDGTNTGFSMNASNEAIFYNLLRATNAGESILASADIRTNGVFVKSGNSGVSTTIDLSGIGGPVITVSGGIITNVV